MKRCPQCNRTYSDDALSFCLDDGSPLVTAAAPSSFDPGATVQYPQETRFFAALGMTHCVCVACEILRCAQNDKLRLPDDGT